MKSCPDNPVTTHDFLASTILSPTALPPRRTSMTVISAPSLILFHSEEAATHWNDPPFRGNRKSSPLHNRALKCHICQLESRPGHGSRRYSAIHHSTSRAELSVYHEQTRSAASWAVRQKHGACSQERYRWHARQC